MPTAESVVDRAEMYARTNYDWTPGYCLRFARSCAGVRALYLTATEGWRGAQHRHLVGTPPRGSFVWWSGGGKGYGHVAVSDGRGYVWSTDIVRMGMIDRVSLAYLAARWGNLTYLGWSEDINGVRVTDLPVAATFVNLANLRPGLRNADVADFQTALRRAGFAALNPSGVTGYYGKETLAMCAAFQRKQGWDDADANGVPGPKTCALLGLMVA